MSVAAVLKIPITEGQIVELNGEDWTVIAVAADQSKVVIKRISDGKVKMVSGW